MLINLEKLKCDQTSFAKIQSFWKIVQVGKQTLKCRFVDRTFQHYTRIYTFSSILHNKKIIYWQIYRHHRRGLPTTGRPRTSRVSMRLPSASVRRRKYSCMSSCRTWWSRRTPCRRFDSQLKTWTLGSLNIICGNSEMVNNELVY